jgi:hypothetical protein
MVEVCQGNKSKHDMLQESIEEYREMYVIARNNFNKVIDVSCSLLLLLSTRDSCCRVFAGSCSCKMRTLAQVPVADGGVAVDVAGAAAEAAGGTTVMTTTMAWAEEAVAEAVARGVAAQVVGEHEARRVLVHRRRCVPHQHQHLRPLHLRRPLYFHNPRMHERRMTMTTVRCFCNYALSSADFIPEAMWDILDEMDAPPPKPKPKPVAPPKRPSAVGASLETPGAGPSRQTVLRPDGLPDVVRCLCGTPAKQITVKKEGPNTGRSFWGCAKPRIYPDDQPCGFFQWADVETPAGGSTVPAKRPISAVVCTRASYTLHLTKGHVICSNRTPRTGH